MRERTDNRSIYSLPHAARLGAMVVLRWAMVGVLALGATASAVAQSIAAGFQPDRIVLGQNAAFIIELEGEPRLDEVQPPAVDGLRFSPAGTGTNFSAQIINGRLTERRTLSIRFVVQPSRAGTFEVPAFPIRVDGRTLTVPASRLQVIPPSGGSAGATLEDIYSLEIILPERTLWVGEDLALTARLRIDGAIELVNLTGFGVDGDDFGNTRVAGDVSRSVETGSGNPRRRFDIPVRLTPLKSGALPLQVSVAAEMRFPRSGRGAGDPFGLPSIFRDFERRNIESRPQTVEIRPLPNPAMAGFTGGVGRFAARAAREPASVQVGEPVTVTLTVTGEGNFERLQAPAFAESTTWRTYEPRVEFSAADATGARGTKTFTYTLIPLSEATSAMPALPLASFDPETGQYVALPLPTLPVTVRPAPERPPTPPLVARTSATETPANELLPDTQVLGRSVLAITPDLASPGFWLWVGAPAPVLALAWLAGWWHRRVNDPGYRSRAEFRAALRAALDTANRQAHAGDAAAFHAAAASVLRLLAARALHHSPESLTAAEIDRGLDLLALSDEERAAARRLLATADLHRYGGAVAVRASDLSSAATALEHLARRHG